MTALLLVVSWFALCPQRWRWGLVNAALAAGVYGAVVLSVGPRPGSFQQGMFSLDPNTWAGRDGLFSLSMLLPLFILLIVSARRAPADLRRLILIVSAVYLPLWLFKSAWNETRLLMPFLILLLPLVKA